MLGVVSESGVAGPVWGTGRLGAGHGAGTYLGIGGIGLAAGRFAGFLFIGVGSLG